jgi:hypothetical protein
MSQKKMFDTIESMISHDAVKVDMNKTYIMKVQVNIMCEEGRYVVETLNRNDTFVIEEAPQHYRPQLIALVKGFMAEEYKGESYPTPNPPKAIEDLTEEDIIPQILEAEKDSNTKVIPTMVDGKISKQSELLTKTPKKKKSLKDTLKKLQK